MRRALLALALAAAGGACDGPPPALAENALLVTLDTTRADALGCYGAPHNPTPRLDALARRGILFEHASTAVPLTLPAHCSMLTGLYPPRHTVRDNAYWPLPASADTLAERARAAGLATAAFVAAVVLDRPFGLDQGFDVYDPPTPAPGGDRLHGERRADEVVDRAIAWLDGRDRGRRFFLWVHLFDPHTPYAPPPGARADLPPYAAELAFADRELGRLLDRMDQEGLLATTLVVVAGDHGEAFGEHGEVTHGDFCYQPTLAVPLLVARPDGAGAGTREAGQASIVDVAPSVLDALGIQAPQGIDGRSLLAGPPPPERGVYFESYSGWFAQGWSPLAGWRDARGKYLHSSAPELYDLGRDPGEERDLAAERPDDVRAYRLAMADLLARPALASGAADALDPELLASIQGLGYAAMGGAYDRVPSPLAPTARPAPRGLAEQSRRAYDAANLVVAGRHAEAEPLLRAVLAENPLHFVALQHLAYALIFQGRPAEAIEPLQTLLREGPKKAEWFEQLGACLFRSGRAAEAVEPMRQAVAIEPGNERYREELARLLRELGRADEAARVAAGG